MRHTSARRRQATETGVVAQCCETKTPRHEGAHARRRLISQKHNHTRTLVFRLPVGTKALFVAKEKELALGASQLGRVLLGTVLALAHGPR